MITFLRVHWRPQPTFLNRLCLLLFHTFTPWSFSIPLLQSFFSLAGSSFRELSKALSFNCCLYCNNTPKFTVLLLNSPELQTYIVNDLLSIPSWCLSVILNLTHPKQLTSFFLSSRYAYIFFPLSSHLSKWHGSPSFCSGKNLQVVHYPIILLCSICLIWGSFYWPCLCGRHSSKTTCMIGISPWSCSV